MFNKDNFDQYYYGHGKLLLSSEYFVLDGAKGLAIPTKVGQEMGVNYKGSGGEKLHWKSYNDNNELWFESTFDLWHFNIIDGEESKEALLLQKLLRQSRAQNKHFLREDVNVDVVTKLGFPLNWGLGSSSSLIYNISQWAYISPFELLFKSYGGSGYDIACAQSSGPIVYTKNNTGPYWAPVEFNPVFKDNLYFLYLGQKQDSTSAINFYRSLHIDKKSDIVKKLSKLTNQMISCTNAMDFSYILDEHENIISNSMGIPKVQDRLFKDFSGNIKSLGAWGGDFALILSKQSPEETRNYFNDKGFNILLTYDHLILSCENFYDTEKNMQSQEEQYHEFE